MSLGYVDMILQCGFIKCINHSAAELVGFELRFSPHFRLFDRSIEGFQITHNYILRITSNSMSSL
jgi:hypothetical protein